MKRRQYRAGTGPGPDPAPGSSGRPLKVVPGRADEPGMARVLVVDDDPDTVRIVTFRLQQQGHQVAGTTSAVEALSVMADRGRPDVVVADVSMPDLDGLQFAGRLREDPQLADVPVIFLSARVTPEDIETGQRLGATYLTKPFIAAALLAKIDEVTRPRLADTSW